MRPSSPAACRSSPFNVALVCLAGERVSRFSGFRSRAEMVAADGGGLCLFCAFGQRFLRGCGCFGLQSEYNLLTVIFEKAVASITGVSFYNRALTHQVNPVSIICRLLSALLYPNINFSYRIVFNAVYFIAFFKLVNYLKFPLRAALAVVVVASIVSVSVSYWVVWYHINTGRINLVKALAIGL
ncbi:hypothetical protein RHMOL_Rhmol03G0017000 [Rhododendron molle]|nr:hypothetical protein RHMOL_Rhmol03G0017000 [Rhododendron molle]